MYIFYMYVYTCSTAECAHVVGGGAKYLHEYIHIIVSYKVLYTRGRDHTRLDKFRIYTFKYILYMYTARNDVYIIYAIRSSGTIRRERELGSSFLAIRRCRLEKKTNTGAFTIIIHNTLM